MESISKVIIQTDLTDDWDHVEKKIEESKIFRVPYKAILDISFTKYILKCRDEGLDSTQTIAKILREPSMQDYIRENIHKKDKIIENIITSTKARFSEERS